MDGHRADNRIQQRKPHHIARDDEVMPAQRERQRPRHRPQDAEERNQRHRRIEETQRQREGGIGEVAQIVGDPLVGVVGRVGLLQAVEGLFAEPAVKEAAGDPRPPAHAQHHRVVLAQHGGDDDQRGDPGEAPELAPEFGLVLLFQRVVEQPVPVGEQHVHVDHEQAERDHQRQQAPGLVAVLREPVRLDELPRLGQVEPAVVNGQLGDRVLVAIGRGGGARCRHGEVVDTTGDGMNI